MGETFDQELSPLFKLDKEMKTLFSEGSFLSPSVHICVDINKYVYLVEDDHHTITILIKIDEYDDKPLKVIARAKTNKIVGRAYAVPTKYLTKVKAEGNVEIYLLEEDNKLTLIDCATHASKVRQMLKKDGVKKGQENLYI